MTAWKAFSMWAGAKHRWLCPLAVCLFALGVSCEEQPPGSDGIFVGKVIASTPVRGAHVSVWQLYVGGEKYGLLAEATTDETGTFSVHVGQVLGNILFEVTGGVTAEPWAPDEQIALDMELRAVLTDYLPGPLGTVQFVSITPLTTMATALGESRLADPDEEDNYKDAMRRAYALLGEHFGDVNLISTPVVRTTIEAHNMRDGVRHGLVIAGLSGLAQWMAEYAGVSAQAINTLALTEKLVEDASDEGAIFDGVGRDGQLRMLMCAQPPACQADPTSCEPSVCELDANTLRADLATGLAFYFMPAADNGTGLTFDQVRTLIESIWTHEQPELFGITPIGDLGGKLPAAMVGMSLVDDEWTDEITFSPAAVPSYARTGQWTLLGGPGACEAQVVRKYVTRMDDRDDNPVRWEFSVIDRRGVGIDRDGGAYRVGLRGPDGVDWLTEWRPATPLVTSRTDGVDYEVVLLRSELPELATQRGIFEIEFRGRDTFEKPTPVARSCWDHVPLAAPLWVGPAADVPASDPRSLYGVTLGDGLAPLLNGVPLAEGKAIMAFEIRNGTTEPVYVTLDLEQPAASYTKSWQKTNVFLHPNPASGCIDSGDCTMGFPPDRRTITATDVSGTIASLVEGLQIIDQLAGDSLAPCAECQPNEFKLEARLDVDSPRMYRVLLIVSDLSGIAPQPLGEEYGPFHDIPIDPLYYLTPITGRVYGQIRICKKQTMPGYCDGGDDVYVHYVALEAASIIVDWLRVNGRVRPATNVPAISPGPQPNTFGLPVELTAVSRTWSQALPAPNPAL